MRRTAFFVRHRPLQERALDGPMPHEKSAQLTLSAFALVVIRLGFAKMRCFTRESGALLVLLVLVNILIYNVINAFVVVWIGDNIPDFAR